MTYSIKTSGKSEEASALLLQSHEWTTPELAEPLSKERLLSRFDTIAWANAQVNGTLDDEFATAYDTSTQFVRNAFDVFDKKIESEQYEWAFAVPARGEQAQGDEYSSEVTFFLPLLSPQFGVNSLIRQSIVTDLVPTVIEQYSGSPDGTRGAILWTPIHTDLNARRGRAYLHNLDRARYRADEAADFARNTLGVRVMGLGAIIPMLTKHGTTIQQEGLVTTTGHGGTVHLVAETVQEVAEKLDKNITIGVLGLGAIGHASLKVLRENYTDLSVDEYLVFDMDQGKMLSALTSSDTNTRTLAAERDVDLLENADIIVTAVTIPVDLDEREKKYGKKIDLTGKIIVDDSQPGCFDRAQVEARGGKLVWVVGHDGSKDHSFKRMDGYAFGDAAGLYDEWSVWGCEAEAGSIAMTKSYEHAVQDAVRPEIARKVGAICKSMGIKVSHPLQSFGRTVDI